MININSLEAPSQKELRDLQNMLDELENSNFQLKNGHIVAIDDKNEDLER